MGRRQEFGLGQTEFEMQFKIDTNLKRRSRGEPLQAMQSRGQEPRREVTICLEINVGK